MICLIPILGQSQYSLGVKGGLTYSNLIQRDPYFRWESQYKPGYSTEFIFNDRISERFSVYISLGHDNLNAFMSGAYGSKFESTQEEGNYKIYSIFFDIQPRLIIFKRINLELLVGLSTKRIIITKFEGYRNEESINDNITSSLGGTWEHLQLGLGYQIKLSEKVKCILESYIYRSLSGIVYHSEHFDVVGLKVNLGLLYSLN